MVIDYLAQYISLFQQAPPAQVAALGMLYGVGVIVLQGVVVQYSGMYTLHIDGRV
jgi:hypothetical protein